MKKTPKMSLSYEGVAYEVFCASTRQILTGICTYLANKNIAVSPDELAAALKLPMMNKPAGVIVGPPSNIPTLAQTPPIIGSITAAPKTTKGKEAKVIPDNERCIYIKTKGAKDRCKSAQVPGRLLCKRDLSGAKAREQEAEKLAAGIVPGRKVEGLTNVSGSSSIQSLPIPQIAGIGGNLVPGLSAAYGGPTPPPAPASQPKFELTVVPFGPGRMYCQSNGLVFMHGSLPGTYVCVGWTENPEISKEIKPLTEEQMEFCKKSNWDYADPRRAAGYQANNQPGPMKNSPMGMPMSMPTMGTSMSSMGTPMNMPMSMPTMGTPMNMPTMGTSMSSMGTPMNMPTMGTSMSSMGTPMNMPTMGTSMSSMGTPMNMPTTNMSTGMPSGLPLLTMPAGTQTGNQSGNIPAGLPSLSMPNSGTPTISLPAGLPSGIPSGLPQLMTGQMGSGLPQTSMSQPGQMGSGLPLMGMTQTNMSQTGQMGSGLPLMGMPQTSMSQMGSGLPLMGMPQTSMSQTGLMGMPMNGMKTSPVLSAGLPQITLSAGMIGSSDLGGIGDPVDSDEDDDSDQ